MVNMSTFIDVLIALAIIVHGWMISRAIRSLSEAKKEAPPVFDPNRRGN